MFAIMLEFEMTQSSNEEGSVAVGELATTLKRRQRRRRGRFLMIKLSYDKAFLW